MRSRASLTAEYMALFRAIESARPANARLFCDPFAARFLHRRRKWLYEIARCGAGRALVERLLDRASPGARAAGIARTKWIDDEVTRALETSSQLVLLGAGFDTRAYRLPAAQRASTFELDRAEMSSAKQAALREKIGSLPERVQFGSIDFNTQPVGDVLGRAGFDGTRPACFVWEGVTNYLSAEAVDGILRQIGQAAGGSILLFTYVDRRVLDEPKLFFGAEKLLSRLALIRGAMDLRAVPRASRTVSCRQETAVAARSECGGGVATGRPKGFRLARIPVLSSRFRLCRGLTARWQVRTLARSVSRDCLASCSARSRTSAPALRLPCILPLRNYGALLRRFEL